MTKHAHSGIVAHYVNLSDCIRERREKDKSIIEATDWIRNRISLEILSRAKNLGVLVYKWTLNRQDSK